MQTEQTILDEAWLEGLIEDFEWPKAKPWIKLYRRWYTTDSHLGLDGTVLGFGAAVLPIINSAPCPVDANGTAWLVTRGGHILTTADFARETKFTPRQVVKAVNCLVNCRTFEHSNVSGSVIISVPNFAHWQSTPAAVKKAREREANVNALANLGPEYVAGYCEAKGLILVDSG